ncbi:MAG: MFS transporter [Planctomycetes bacterium]|nr:MFS transporter [Planctomycetota bacterium]
MTTASSASSLSASARWRIVLLLMGFAALGHFNRVGISVAGGEIFIEQLSISEGDMGWVYTTFLIVYLSFMLPGGWLIDRIGAVKALTLLGLTMGTFVMLTGALGWVTNTPDGLLLGLLVIRGLAGACSAPLHPGAAHVVSGVMSPQRRATANGMVTAGALIGIACCYPIFGWMIDRFDWPWAFVVSGAILMAYGLLWKLLASPLVPSPQTSVSVGIVQNNSKANWSLAWDRNLWLLTLSYAAYSYFQYLFFYWMNFYFQKVLHVPKLESREISFYITLAQGAGMAIGGLSTDVMCHWFGRTRGRRAIAMTGMGLGTLFGLLSMNVEGTRNVAICLAISMATLGMCEGVFWTTATDIGGKSRGSTGAFLNTGGNIGGAISPRLTPKIAESLGLSGAITVACIVAGLGGLLWFWIKPPEAGLPASDHPSGES